MCSTRTLSFQGLYQDTIRWNSPKLVQSSLSLLTREDCLRHFGRRVPSSQLDSLEPQFHKVSMFHSIWLSQSSCHLWWILKEKLWSRKIKVRSKSIKIDMKRWLMTSIEISILLWKVTPICQNQVLMEHLRIGWKCLMELNTTLQFKKITLISNCRLKFKKIIKAKTGLSHQRTSMVIEGTC